MNIKIFNKKKNKKGEIIDLYGKRYFNSLFFSWFLWSRIILIKSNRCAYSSLINHRTIVKQTYRYVTPSLAELGGRGNLPEMNKHVLMLTRVPGAGAELLVLILQRLQGYNAFKHIRLPPGDSGLLTTLQQVNLDNLCRCFFFSISLLFN